jgi:hypothetical protein
MSVIMPTLLSRANKEGEALYQETSTRLLELAANDQNAFRAVVGSLNEGQKSFMESVIVAGRKSGPVRNVENADSEGREPTIALRMNFGG